MLINSCSNTSAIDHCAWAKEVLPIKPSRTDTFETKMQVLKANKSFDDVCVAQKPPCTHFGVPLSKAACGG